MRRTRGFTLVEVMLVVAIIGLLAALTYPSLMRARANAYAGAAVGSLRTAVNACETYRATHRVYPAGFAALTAQPHPYLIESFDTTATGRPYEGHQFFYVLGDGVQARPDMYYIYAVPAIPGVTGTRVFYVDETGVVRVGTFPCALTRAYMSGLPPIQ